MNFLEKLSEERKQGQALGEIPDWMSTAGWQVFKGKYLYQAKTVREQFRRIAKTAAQYAPDMPSYSDVGYINPEETKAQYWEEKFFYALWNGWLCCSTPILANMGTDRGCAVSCSGGKMGDDVGLIYDAKKEIAVLTKQGFGTSVDLSDIRPRGAPISVGGTAFGVLPIIKSLVEDMRYINQGSRRGAVAVYLDIEHEDFWEVAEYVQMFPEDLNIGWNIRNSFIEKLKFGDEEANNRWKRVIHLRLIPGRGYLFFIDKANAKRPQTYVDNGLFINNSNLCSEIMLHNDVDNYTYTCVLSWLNLSKWDEWKNTDTIYVATVFLDCVVSDFIAKAKNIRGLEKAVASTEKGRAIGLGVGGFHSYLQKNRISYGSLEAHMWNNEVFKKIHEESMRASKDLAASMGEPEWCKGTGERFTHRTAVPPTKTTALIYGGISEGINPDQAMFFTQPTPAGDVNRINPVLLELIKERGLDVDQCTKDVVDSYGSVQKVSWLTDDEKEVFLLAREINQDDVLRLASTRQRFICQGQSLNLSFANEEDEERIAEIHQKAALDPNILSLYYTHTARAVVSARTECEACQ